MRQLSILVAMYKKLTLIGKITTFNPEAWPKNDKYKTIHTGATKWYPRCHKYLNLDQT